MADQVQEPIQNHKAPADHLLKNVDLGPPQQPHKKTDGNTAFLRAARSGNLEKVLEFINSNVDINTSNSNGLNALHLASKDGHVEVATELLKRGANVDAATKKGNTALHIASLAGQEEVVKLLIEHGASVNLQSQSGFTPLYMAAQENHERVVRYLLNNGANQSLATEDGFTPLAVAMQQGHDKVVTELLENDTRGKIKLPALHIAAKKDDCKAAALLLQSEHNPDITSKSGFTPLHIASHYGNDAIASLLLAKGADVNYAAKHNITPLHVAAKWGRNNMVILLLDKGASIIAKTRDGLTPLHCAARSGHEEVVDTLLQRHAPITAKTKNGLAPLHMASQGDHVDAARVLLSHRAPVDDVTVDYLTALHVASHCGHVSVAKLLLDRKADPNARALNGFTPLHIACKKNRVKIVELLLKHGGSIEATTESGLSPLHVASFMGCMNIVIYLLQCGANPDVSTIRGETPLHLASRANQTDIIRILLRNGAQVDAKAREQQTPLHIAARLGNTDIVMLLLQHGANVDSVTKDLYTSLHIAAKEDQEEVAQALLENNASMTATTKKGFTPLHLAAKYGRSAIATLLLQRGAPVDAQGKNGVTPLHVASHYDHQGIALLLLDKGASPHATAKNGHTPLHIAAKKNQMDIAAMLLEYGANAGAESKAGFTPLHLSAQEGHVDMTNLLLEHKAEVNHSSKNGLTPLHLCAQEDCVDVATILVKNGANVDTVTKAGYTPLHIASHFGQLNMVRFLLSNKAKVDTSTSTGYTPLHQAAQQGNSAIVAVLLDNGASPDTKNNQGQTALCIAQKLGYISVVEVLKNVTDNTKAAPVTAAPAGDEKYKVVAPETMQENFMSDSEDEGGEDATNEQSYRYLTIDEMKSLGDDSLPIDTSKEDRYDTTAGHDESISPQHTYNQLNAAPVIDNVDVTRAPVIQTGFLVSFLVDAKGGAMRGCRHSGVRVIVPPQCVTMPTRVTCRYIRRDKPNHPPPPPLMEGEALASRILELGPVGVKFLGPVVIEVPNFAALRANEREIVILRSDNGETWREHTTDSSSDVVHDILSRSFDKDGNQVQSDEPNRITSIVTNDFPHYFAIVSRIRQEVHAIGPEGGMVSSSVVPQVQAVFPQGALTKKIKVGLQAQPIPSDLTAAVLGNCVAVSPIVTIEPRRRKFHKPITLTLPVPQAANKGMINQYSGDAPTLRLLCSITGGTSRAQWEDVTGSTPLTFVKECVSFTTTVSARFWLMDIRDIAVATKKATELYREAIHIPFMAKFVVFAKRIDNNEARLRVFCMTDDKEDKTLECQEHFTEVAKSRDVEVLEGKKQLIELSGNLISVTKSGDQLKLGFNAFQENRLPFTIRIKDSLADPIGRMLFFKEQKPVKTSTPHPPICVLNIVLPDTIIPDSEFADSPIRKYNLLNDSQGYHRSELKFSDISNLIGDDWEALAEKLGIRSSECKVIKIENPEGTARQSSVMLKQWNQRAGTKATSNILESALLSIGREDIIQECFLNTNQNNKLPSENGLITHKSEDIRGTKKDPYSTDDDERKYTAEEKIIDESELKSVSERKQEIEKRLQDEQHNKKENLKERSESEEKRQPASKQSSEDKEIIKNVVHDDKESFEPTKLTFQQKRLSFEKGYSVDKILSEGIAAGDTTQAVVEELDKAWVREKSVEKTPQKEPSVDKVPDKGVQKGNSVDDKVPVPKNKSDDKIAQKADQKEKSPEDKKPAQKGKSVEKSASKDKVDKVVEKSPSTDKVVKGVEKSASKDKVDKSLEKSASKDKVDKSLEKSASKDKVDKTLEKSASKDKVDKPLEKSASKDKVYKTLEKSASKDKVNQSLEKSGSKDKINKPVEKSASKDKVDKTLEKSASKDKVDKTLEKSKDKVDKSVEKSSSKDKIDEKVPSVVEKTILEEKVTLPQKSKSPEKQSPKEKSPPKEGEDKSLIFQENLLSFEHKDSAPTVISHTTVITETKLPNDETKSTIQTTTTVEKRSDTDARRDSELFEGVSLGLGKLEAKPIPLEQNFLSPKPLMTPPPSPAEFKEGSEEWRKTDSLDSNKSATDLETPSETQTVTPTEYAELESRIISNEHPASGLNNLSEDSIEKLPVPDYNFESIAAESVSELEALPSSRVQIIHESPAATSKVEQHSHSSPAQQPQKYTDEMIDKLIEQERAKLIASGIKFDSDTDDEVENESSKRNGRSRVDSSSDEDNQDVNSDSDAELVKYLKASRFTDDDHVASDHSERSPQRKVAFRLNSDESELVYPGQTDSEENTSTSDNSEDSPPPGSASKDDPVPVLVVKDPKVDLKTPPTPPNEVERKFERMASETEDDVVKVEGEFHRIVSQLSFEEVTDCLNAWNETESAAKHEGDKPKPVAARPEGNKQLSTESDTTRSFSRGLESDHVEKEESMDYVSRKKFWQSFESASVDKGAGTTMAPAPVPKPRASICTTGVTIDDSPLPVAAKRSNENIRNGFAASKSESMQERASSDTERFGRPSMKKVHSLTSYSTDSEAEYIANCGIEKLAYENVAFSEEDESISEARPDPEVESGVKAKKMLFEKMQSSSSQESITSPTSKKDDISGVVKTSAMSAEKQIKKESSRDSVSSTSSSAGLVKSATASIEKRIEPPVKRDSSQESVTSPWSKKDSSLDGVSITSSSKGLVNSATDSIEKRIEQPVKRDSSQESVTSPLSKKDFSQDGLSITSSSKGLVKSATDSIEKRIEQPVKRDSSQESVTSPSSKKDVAGMVKTSVAAAEKQQIKKDYSQESISSTSSSKGLVKSATNSIEKRIEQPVKRDSSQESVTSSTGLVKNAARSIEQPIKKEPSQESISSTCSKNSESLGIVKSATKSIEQIIKHESSIESVPTLTSPLLKDSSLDSVSSVSSKKDEPIVIISKREETTETISKKGEPSVTTSEKKETVKTTSESQEPFVSIDGKYITTSIIDKEPSVTVSKQEKVEVTSSTKEEPVVTTKAKDTVTTTSTEIKKEEPKTVVEPAVTVSKQEKVEVTTSIKEQPVITTQVKETVTTTSMESKKEEPKTDMTTTAEETVSKIISKEEKTIESIEKHLEQTIVKESILSGVSSKANRISTPNEIAEMLKKDTTVEKIASKGETYDEIKTTTIVSTKSTEQPLIKDSSLDNITIDQSASPTPAVIRTTTTVTTTEMHSKPSVEKDGHTEQPLIKDSSQDNITIDQSASPTPAGHTKQPLIKDSSRDNITIDQSASPTPAVIRTTTTVTTTEMHSKPSIEKDSHTVSSTQPDDLSKVPKSTVTVEETVIEKSVCKDDSLDSINSLSSKKDDQTGAPRRDSSLDSSSLSLKKDRSIEAIDSLKLDNKISSVSEPPKPNGSLDESISTQSESDITPEDLRDKQFIMQDWESTSELLENLVTDRIIPMSQSSAILIQDIDTPHQIRFSDAEQYKLYNDVQAVGEEDLESEALKEEAKAAAENLINEIEEELGRRPDIVECLLKSKIDELVEEIATSSNDITDEDLKSTGSEVGIPTPYGLDDPTLMKMKISQASPTEYEIKFEQVEEFNILESVDFEEPILPEDLETSLKSGSESFSAVISKKEVTKPSKIPIRNGAKSESKSPSVQRKTSEDDKSTSRTSTSPEYVQDFIEIRHQSKNRKSGADFEPCSSSSESHYHSFEQSGTTSRPLSSDVEGLLSAGGGVPGTTGSSEYETAASHDTSHDFHTAMSSASLHESIKSIDSESSGNLGSAEVSSEVSETLVASSAELDHDIDLPPSHYYDDNKRSVYSSSPIEPYDHEIPMEVIKGVSQSFDMSHLEPFASSQKKSAENVTHARPHSTKFKEDSHEIDDKLLSSSEDVSMFSLTDGGGNLQTVIEVNSAAESDKMDNSIISEQSLTMSATSNQFSTSSSADLKDDIDADKKPGDSIQSTHDAVTKSGSTTCAQMSTNKIDKSDSNDTICRDISIDDIPNITIQHSTPPRHSQISDIIQESPSKDPSISPDSESFEIIEQPDMMDDFVIIEEVAKEAFEQDPEGKSIKITGKRQTATGYDDEIVIAPPKTLSTLTRVEYYGGADGCEFPIEGVPESGGKVVGDDGEIYEHEVEEGKKWIEMQFQTDSEDASGYEYNYERGTLEDIKEEDTDEMQSSKMGSVGSQISQSIGSLGSMKQSLSSTPDYDILAGKRYFTNKSSDKDDVSQGSLQEFERLEQLMTLESVKSKLSGSQDSLGSSSSTNGGGGKKRSATGDDISVSSLNEFEGLEHACLEAEKIKERARIEEHLLSQIEEGHESQASESESCETLEKSCYESDNDEDYDQKMFEIDEIIRQAQSNVEKFIDVDQLERTESLGRGDSFEETARIPDFELDQPLTENIHSSTDIYSGKKYIEHIDLSHSLTTSTDSLEPKCKPEDILVTSTDSLEGGPTTGTTTSKSKSTVISDSLDATDNRVESPRSAYDADEELLHGDPDIRQLSPHHLMLSSPDSLDATSSAATHATYHNETDSAMSSSFTSAGSNTMISSTENLENIVTNYSNWLDSNPYMTEVISNVTEKSYVTTERSTELSSQQKITSSQGQDAKKLFEQDMAAFKPGEYYTETQEVDNEGNIRIKRVVESRAIVTSEKVQNSEKITLDPDQFRRANDTDFTTISSSSSHYVTTTESSSGIKTETSVRIEKKDVPGEASSDKSKS